MQITSINLVAADEHVEAAAGSIVRSTSLPFELIIVDAGVSGETRVRLARLFAPPLQRTEILRVPDGCGYAAACNRGALIAAGTWLVFLRGDVEVHAGWLQGLMTAIEHDSPSVGAVGPVCNEAATPQQWLGCETYLRPGMEAERRRIADTGHATLRAMPMAETIAAALAALE